MYREHALKSRKHPVRLVCMIGSDRLLLTTGSGITIFNQMVKYKEQVDLDTLFFALSDPTRRTILEKLKNGPASVTELAEPFRISFPAVSKHLAVLSQAGLVETKKDGRTHWIHLRSAPLKDAVAWLDCYEKFWNERLDALERMVRSMKHSKKKRG